MQKRCPVCGGSSRLFLRHIDFFNRRVALRKCVKCGHGFYSRKYSDSELSKIYEEDYASEYLGHSSEGQALREQEYFNDLDRLFSEAPELRSRNVSALDIGCSAGGFLRAMPPNWSKHGTEVNPVYLADLSIREPTWKISASLEDFSARKFDLVSLRGVVEHIQTHHDLLNFLSEALSPGGFVLVTATPDFSSAPAALYGPNWKQIVCPEHIHQFTSTSLVLLFAKAGLAPIAIRHPYQDSVYARPEEDSKNFLDLLHQRKEFGVSTPDYDHAFPGNMMTCVFRRPH